MTRRAWVGALVGGAVGALAASCSAVPSNARIGVDEPPESLAEFGPVGDYLDHRCGTLDCHGQSSRNLRIWGCEGMRPRSERHPVLQPRLGRVEADGRGVRGDPIAPWSASNRR